MYDKEPTTIGWQYALLGLLVVAFVAVFGCNMVEALTDASAQLSNMLP